MKSLEDKEKFIQLRANGHSYQAISSMINVSEPTLYQWSKEFSQSIKTLKTMREEAIYQEFAATKEARIRLLGEQIERVKEELSTRDLTYISTEKLYVILLKLVELQCKEVDSLAVANSGILRLERKNI